MSDAVIKLENVSKYYKLYDTSRDRLKEALNPFGKKYHKEFYALNDISFKLRKGECLGIIGRNGAGKSTLLKIISHVIPPSSGIVMVNGTISALLELGTGFNPEFTGWQNIFFYGAILGFKKGDIEKEVDEIVKFADIGQYINQPVKTYSNGMYLRLAFAIQTSLVPDILIVDEVLSVGDIFFQQRCHQRIEKLLSRGTALILASHDMQAIEKYSTNTLLLDRGETQFYGNPNDAVQRYYSLFDDLSLSETGSSFGDENFSEVSNNEEKSEKNNESNWPPDDFFIDTQDIEQIGNSQVAKIMRFCVCNAGGKQASYFDVGDTISFYYEVAVKKDIGIPVGAVVFINSHNIVVHGKDTLQYSSVDDYTLNIVKANSVVRFLQTFKLDIAPGEYTFSIGFASIDPDKVDRINNVSYTERDTLIKSITRIPHAGKLLIGIDNITISLPFHGYVDLEGSFELFIN